MRILWFTWKDKKNPLSGGAEVMNEELAKRAVKDGHEVIFLVAAYSGCKKKEVIDGYTVIRIGGRQTIYIAAALYYLKYLRSWPDLIIEEINTVPFLTNIYAPSKKRILFIYQLAREIWFHELPKKMYLLSALGYLCEPLYLRFLSNEICFTESQSTQKDLTSYGFAKKNIHIIPPGTNIQPIESLHKIEKYKHFTVLSLGSIRSMKQTLHQIEAFETIKARVPHSRMIVAGNVSTPYGHEVLKYISQSPYKDDIIFRGSVTEQEKKELMQKAHVIVVTSIKEGWGLIVTEANSQGTPAVVYDVDGLRDAVHDGETGLLSIVNDPKQLAEKVVSLHDDPILYMQLQKNALAWSKKLTFDQSYRVFKESVESLF